MKCFLHTVARKWFTCEDFRTAFECTRHCRQLGVLLTRMALYKYSITLQCIIFLYYF